MSVIYTGNMEQIQHEQERWSLTVDTIGEGSQKRLLKRTSRHSLYALVGSTMLLVILGVLQLGASEVRRDSAVLEMLRGFTASTTRRLQEAALRSPGYETNSDVQSEAAAASHGQLQTGARNAPRQIMYTFYTFIDGETGMSSEADQKLLKAWKDEWRRHGWEPRIIGLEEAQQHNDYARLFALLGGLEMKVYDRYCFLRWLAMSVVGGGWISDYDTFPLHTFDGSLPNEGKLTVHEYSKNGGVPDMVSGSAVEFDRMAKLLIEDAVHHKSEMFWSDMLALHDLYVNHDAPYLRESHVVPGQVITKHTKRHRICNRTNGKYAVHFSHYAMEFGGHEAAVGPEHRAELAQMWLADWRSLCLSTTDIAGA